VTAGRLNLARKPFVDTRAVTATVAALVVAVVILTGVNAATIWRYVEGSRKTRETIARLRADIDRTDGLRRTKEAALARVDVAELSATASEATALARRRRFSWTRFLTRLEESLPGDVRVVSVLLHKEEETGKTAVAKDLRDSGANVDLSLVAKDLDAMPKVLRALYASPWFDRPEPRAEQGLDRTNVEGARLQIGVVYLDGGKAR
jgi:Tfp pilus assembly protein PilN